MTALQPATPFLPLSGGTVTGTITDNGHLQFGGTIPGAAAGGQAGSSPPSPVVATGANDCAGTITFGTGTLPSTGTQVQMTFASPFSIPGGGTPHIVICPVNAATQALGLYVSGASPTGFGVSAAVAPAAGQGNTTYSFSYVALG